MTEAARGRTVPPVDRHRRDLAIDLGICAAIVAYGLPPMLDASVNDPRATTIGPLLIPALLVASPSAKGPPARRRLRVRRRLRRHGIPTFHQFRLVVAVPVAVAILFPLSTRAPRGRALAGLAALLAGLVFVGATESVVHGVARRRRDGRVRRAASLAVWGAGRIVRRESAPRRSSSRRSEQLACSARRPPRWRSRSTASASRRSSMSPCGHGCRR